MSESTPPWEPPKHGTDTEQVLASIERMRATFRWKADGLDAPALAHRVGASALTLGGLLKHLAIVEDHYFTNLFAGEGYPCRARVGRTRPRRVGGLGVQDGVGR